MSLLAITHYTVTSALGRGRAQHLAALQSESSGLTKVAFDTCNLACWLGEVRGLDAPLPRELATWECRNNRLAWLALHQDGFFDAAQALRARYGADRVGVFIGTSTAGIYAAELAYRECRSGADAAPAPVDGLQLTVDGPRGRSPEFGDRGSVQNPTAASRLPDWFDYRHTQNIYSTADFVAQALGLCGHVMAISTACSSSAKVFAAAYRAIAMGLCDAAVVGGVDSLCLTTLYGFNSLQLLSADVCKPADASRNGISIGEAGGFALLERPSPARHYEYALLGYGESSDAHHMSSPDPQGRGAAQAMQSALQRAALDALSVGYINLHGTGTKANDGAEDKGVTSVFGAETPCSSTKGWTGHTLGAAGIVEAAITLVCIEANLLPRSLQTQVKDPELHADVLMQARHAPLSVAMSNSFGFGGSNCSLLFGRAA
jgi:3-oxoacyl-[acyl-carrier-protein] synthase-1